MGVTAGILGGASMIMGVSQAYGQSKSLKIQGEYEKSLGQQNARFADLSATDALKRGETDAADAAGETERLIGSQRVALAANGIDPNDKGTASLLQQDAAAAGAREVLTIKNNAWREAWGYRVEALNATSKGEMANMYARQQAKDTLISGGIRALNQGSSAATGFAKTQKVTK